jgi:hypothetical protein
VENHVSEEENHRGVLIVILQLIYCFSITVISVQPLELFTEVIVKVVPVKTMVPVWAVPPSDVIVILFPLIE